MRTETIALLTCPRCKSGLKAEAEKKELIAGAVGCTSCRATYPVLGGVLILVEDVQSYLVEHVKGISRYVPDKEIPKGLRADYLEAKAAIEAEHIEEDLEAERVTSLYLMNHFLKAGDVKSSDPVLSELIAKYWDQGPFAKIGKLLEAASGTPRASLVELGCGVGGLYSALEGRLDSYLGLDSSFASIALARHFVLGTPLPNFRFLVPDDLLQGAVSREIKRRSAAAVKNPSVDFIVCDVSAPPVKRGQFQISAALNVIDMLPEPQALPRLQYDLVSDDGVAIQSCPYVWHPEVASELRRILPQQLRDSAEAVEYLYKEAGFKIDSSARHVPWLFFKHIRQLEIYSVHLFCASKA